MTPEQMELQQYRARMQNLADSCDCSKAKSLYEAKGSRPKTGCLPPVWRKARVMSTGDNALLVDRTEIRHGRFGRSSRTLVPAATVEEGCSLADAWVGGI